MRVVVYAEGAAEAPASLYPPGRPLSGDDLGPAHVLVRRCLAVEASVPEASVTFVAPRRLASGRHAKGSDLLVATVLNKLFVRTPEQVEEDLTILFVDQDGDRRRERTLRELCGRHPRRIAIGVAVPEFEAWLLADLAALRAVVGKDVDEPPALESLPPGEVKARFRKLCEPADQRSVRTEIVSRCDLGRLKTLRSFEDFCQDLRRVLGP